MGHLSCGNTYGVLPIRNHPQGCHKWVVRRSFGDMWSLETQALLGFGLTHDISPEVDLGTVCPLPLQCLKQRISWYKPPKSICDRQTILKQLFLFLPKKKWQEVFIYHHISLSSHTEIATNTNRSSAHYNPKCQNRNRCLT